MCLSQRWGPVTCPSVTGLFLAAQRPRGPPALQRASEHPPFPRPEDVPWVGGPLRGPVTHRRTRSCRGTARTRRPESLRPIPSGVCPEEGRLGDSWGTAGDSWGRLGTASSGAQQTGQAAHFLLRQKNWNSPSGTNCPLSGETPSLCPPRAQGTAGRRGQRRPHHQPSPQSRWAGSPGPGDTSPGSLGRNEGRAGGGHRTQLGVGVRGHAGSLKSGSKPPEEKTAGSRACP